jgi:hypothetical protein
MHVYRSMVVQLGISIDVQVFIGNRTAGRFSPEYI